MKTKTKWMCGLTLALLFAFGVTVYATGGRLLADFLQFSGNSAPAVSPAGKSVWYFDSTRNVTMVSENGGAFATLSPGSLSNSNVRIGTTAGNVLNPAGGAASNVIIGPAAGGALSTGGANVVIGASAPSISTGSNNIVIGGGDATASTAVVLGVSALGGDQGIAIGFSSQAVQAGNVSIGIQSGNASGGANTTFVGYQSGKLCTGADNTIFGYATGDAFTTGARNSLFGKDAGGAAGATAMSDCTFLGYQTGLLNTANQNTFIGASAGGTNTSSTGQVFIGYQAGRLATGSDNTIVGHQAGDAFTTGIRNSFFGSASGGAAAATAATSNSFFGYNSGVTNTADENSFFGSFAGAFNASGTGQCFFGYSAGFLVTGSNNSIFGHNAGDAFTTGARNCLFGKDAGGAAGATAMSDCTFLGYQAGLLNTANQNTYIGASAGDTNASGTGQVFTGYQAGHLVTGNNNTIYGHQAGDSFTTGANNTMIGKDAGGAAGATNISNSTFVGYQAGLLATGGQSTIIGASAGDAIAGGGNACFVGYNAGHLVTAGFNTLIGSTCAAATLITGTDNVGLGYGVSLANVNGQIAIGSGATTTATADCVIGSSGWPMTAIYFGKGVTNATATAYTINGTGGSGSDNAGANVQLAGGFGTGIAANGYVVTKYGLLKATGSTLHTVSTLGNVFSGIIYVSTADATLTANSSTTGTLIGAQTNARPQGTLTLDAQLLDVGSTIRIKGYGLVTMSAGGPTLKIEIKLGSTVIATVTLPNATVTNAMINFESTLVCRVQGSSGTVQGDGFAMMNTTVATGVSEILTMNKAVTTVDTTASQAIDAFGTWSANTAGNTVTITNVTVEFR